MKHRPAGPLLESLLVPDGASWMYFRRRLDGGIPFKWHYHVEYEITLTVNSSGLRYVGDTIEPYGDGDLVLLGSNLPHTWMSQDRMNAADPHVVHVFWIRPDWIHALAETVEELRPVKGLLLNASRGLVFSAPTARAVRALAEDLHAVTAPPARLVRFIELLTLLAQDRDPRPLCVCRADLATPTGGDRHRLDRTLEHIHQHYTGEISLPHLASLAALSVSGLHRLFKRHTRMTVGEYVAQLRIGKACSLLVSTNKPIALIADDVGYANASQFNRRFLTIKKLTPREFRRCFQGPARF
jgi:AraC-like DNA-binding protein